jgi:phosphohistidine phosphatase SixA
MHRLMILRHAKAVSWSSTAEDFPRKLKPAGRKHARNLAAWMCAHLEPPQRILCSPSQRTRETLAPLLSMNPELESVTHFIPQIYHAAASTLETLLDSAFAETERVLIIGHNPAFERLTGEVIHPRHYPEFKRLPTGTLAVVDFDPDWPSAHGSGILRHFIRGKQLSVN